MGTRFKRRKDDKVDKPPYCVVPGERVAKADKTNPENWATHPEALDALGRGDVDAIGFVFTEEDPFFVVDLDRVIDPDTGEYRPGASEVIHAMDTYTELSCSGRGVHIIGVGTKPEYARCKTLALGFEIEVYDRARFVVLTGSQIGDKPIRECQGELENLCARLWPKAKPESSKAGPKPPNTGPVDLEDSVLLERARTSRSGPKFHKLYDQGDTSGYGSHSDADYALLNMLIFWTAGDRERIIELFEASALYRNKSDGKHAGYAALSVDNALASYKGSFYQPKRAAEAREEAKEEDRPDPLAPYLSLMLNPAAWTGRRGASAYKAFAAAVIMAADEGIIDDDGDLRIGTDIRRLAEVAGTSFQTLSASALPYLMKDMKVLKWKRGKGKKAGTLVLKNSATYSVARTLNTKVSTHFSVQSSAPPKHALETLGLLIRMRFGYSKSDALLKLGMPAMFVAVALTANRRHQRGQTAEELAQMTGRRRRDLLAKDGPLRRLNAAGIAQESRDGYFRLTRGFRAKYEYVLEHSGILYAERAQKRRHEDDRRRRDEDLNGRGEADKQPTRLRGREQVERLLRKRRGGEKRGEAGGAMPSPSPEERIKKLVRQGMKPSWARAEVLGGDP
jgi:hypothetical protein